ncbi:MAG: alpha/beta fold hydrolase [Anaerolineales bacterium]|nr:alpha/beta fold hydrolase [Anaerolineales bacterium]
MSQIIPTAEPFFFPAPKNSSHSVGCLLVHGFTGTPKEMRSMGEHLAKQGYSVLGIRLTGHATQPDDMLRSRFADWTASVEDGYQLLHGAADHVHLVGLSMGGVLSLLMSTRLDVKSVVAMSTPYRLPVNYPAWIFRFASYFMPYQPKVKEPPGSSWFDKEAFREQISYPQNPVRSIGELSKLLAAMRAALPEVRVPVQLIHSKDDRYVLPENMEHIYAGLVNASDRQKLYITGSGHVVTRDAARLEIFEAASQFLRRVENGQFKSSRGLD